MYLHCPGLKETSKNKASSLYPCPDPAKADEITKISQVVSILDYFTPDNQYIR